MCPLGRGNLRGRVAHLFLWVCLATCASSPPRTSASARSTAATATPFDRTHTTPTHSKPVVVACGGRQLGAVGASVRACISTPPTGRRRAGHPRPGLFFFRAGTYRVQPGQPFSSVVLRFGRGFKFQVYINRRMTANTHQRPNAFPSVGYQRRLDS